MPEDQLRAILADAGADIGRLDRRGLAEQAAAWFYARPPVEMFVRAELGGPLLRAWIPRLDDRNLERLVVKLSHHLRVAPSGRSRRARVTWLQRQRLGLGYRRLLRELFLEEHRVPVPVGSGIPIPREPPHEVLRGGGRPRAHEPYIHQLEARAALRPAVSERRSRPTAGLLVLPTGAGKTMTVVRWLVDEVLPKGVRVLWLAHQRELLIQAREAFRTAVAEQQPDTAYTARLMVTGAGGITLLGARDTDIALVSLPMLSTRFDRAKKQRLATFLQQPTVVIVDEAHHGGAATYHRALTACLDGKHTRAVIGLTATPWPQSLVSRARFEQIFETCIYEASAADLTARGILARPIFHTVDSDEVVELSDEEVELAGWRPDIPEEVLARLDSVRRNRVVVEAYEQNRELFGKTLVFAANIHHAEALASELSRRGIPTKAVHGQSDDRRPDALTWFEQTSDEAVLVSVRMLTEGVDLPSATTVILARPTTSRILMRQMIGRALRGPLARGASDAHIVYVRDQWTNLQDVLEPPEVVDLPDVEVRTDRRRPGRETDPEVLEPIVGADGTDLPAAVEAEAMRTVEESAMVLERLSREAGSEGSPHGPGHDRFLHPVVRLVASPLAGWYRLADRQIAVFEHQRAAFDELIARAADVLRGTALMEPFDDVPPPWPSQRTARALVDQVRSFGPPPFEPFQDLSVPHVVARELAEGAWTEAEVEAHVRGRWSSGAVRLQMSLVDFEEAVDQERRRLRRRLRGDPSGGCPESAPPASSGETDPDARPKLRRTERDLDAVMDQVAEWMEANTPTLATRLDPLPRIGWTRRPVSSLWGYWTLPTHGRRKGQPHIRINRLLATSKTNVSDDMLGYLVYHELLHHVLSTRGHDVGFRNYEAKWPRAAQLDAEFDTLHERFDTRPSSYR